MNFVVTTADVLEIAGDAMIMMIVKITAMKNIAVQFKHIKIYIIINLEFCKKYEKLV